MGPGGKVVALEDLLAEREAWRREGMRIVLAAGCFDLIHVGHLRYIEDAARHGDIMVVGLNGDEAVRTLKGEGRPLIPAIERAEIIASLRVVDRAVVYPETTTRGLLESLKPDVYAKGTDYSVANVPWREVVEGYGGTVVIAGDPKAHSTRDILARIRERSKRPPGR